MSKTILIFAMCALFVALIFFISSTTSPNPSLERKGSEGEDNHPPAATQTADAPSSLAGQAKEGVYDCKGGEIAKVTRVVDGDTIEIEGGEKVRYIGIDAPEFSSPFQGEVQEGLSCFARESTDENTRLLGSGVIAMSKDVRDRDVYGRLLRYVCAFTTSSVFINGELVMGGFARAAAYPPDTKFANLFEDLEMAAKVEKRGMWGECFSSP